MQNLDSKYNSVMEDLNRGKEEQKSAKVSMAAGPLVRILSDSDLYQLRMCCTRKVETVERLDSFCAECLKDLKEKEHSRYHQLVWKVSGKISPIDMMKGYNKMLKDNYVLRSNFICNKLSMDVTVTYEHTLMNFPIADISNLDMKSQAYKLVNIAAAEARREYNPETSPILRIQAYVLKKGEMAVIVSFIPSLCKQINREYIMRNVFPDMQIEKDVYGVFSESANKMNDSLRKENYEYWKSEMKELGKELLVPGENKAHPEHMISSFKDSIYKQVENEVYQKLCDYCAQNGVSKRSVFLYTWANLLGSYCNEKKSTMAVVGGKDEPKYFPIQVLRNESREMALNVLEKKWTQAAEHGFMEALDMELVYGEKFASHFHMQHHFIDLQNSEESNNLEFLHGNTGCDDIELTVNYSIFKDECRMNYVFDSFAFNEDAIEQLHSMFIHFLGETLAGNAATFDKNSYIKADDGEEEKRRKLAVAQRAIYLQNSKVFELCNAAELMELAEMSVQQHFTMDQDILCADMPAEKIGIVVSGNVEENMIAFDGMVKSMRIISKGVVFGLEALLEDNIMANTYTIASNEAVIIWIKKDDVIPFLNRKPDLYRSILAQSHSQICRLQKVWSME